jgi:hypothetical protein
LSDQPILRLLQADLGSLRLAAAALQRSAAKCAGRPLPSREDPEGEDCFDALTSRFARTADMLTQKILKSTVLLLREDAPTFLDRMNLCAKLGVIPSADEMVAVRDLRNLIAHEYATDDVAEIYAETVRLTPALLAAVGSGLSFCNQRFRCEK